MEPTEDTDLLWIAEEALTAGEPEGWTEQMDPNGNLYYYNGNYGFSPTPRLSKTCPSNAPPSLGFVFLLQRRRVSPRASTRSTSTTRTFT